MDQLISVLYDIRSNLANGAYPNEASVSLGAVLPILRALGWKDSDPKVVSPEYSVSGRRVDFALCHPPSKPMVFVEVKQVGQADGADKQLFEYAFHEGIPLAVLTDGQIWSFYLPAGQGSYTQRRVYLLDVLSRDIDEVASRFARYLSFENVEKGLALEHANSDYRDSSRKRQANESLPEAWRSLVEVPDEQLVALVSSKVEALSGYTPDTQSVSEFLKTIPCNTPPHPDTPKTKVSRYSVLGERQSLSSQPPIDITHNGWEWPQRGAEGYESHNGFVVKAGAIMSPNPGSSLKGTALQKYQQIRKSEWVQPTEKGLRFKRDIVFDSKAQATNVLKGCSESANRVWMPKN